MKIKLSKSQWEFIGKKAGWINKVSQTIDQTMPLDSVQTSDAAQVKFKKKKSAPKIDAKEQSEKKKTETNLEKQENQK